MERIQFSIIIPHHNIPDLLQRCLDSIPDRNDVQILVVDDNSDPSIVDFSNFPGINRRNVDVYLTKEGRGAGYARNVGIENSKGEWLIFSDADDYFNTENLNKLLDGNYNEYDVVGWSCKMEYKGNIVQHGRKIRFDNQDVHPFLMVEPWWKMVKRSFIIKNKIRFQESMVSNDLMYSMKVANACSCYYYFNDTIYYWVKREKSLSGGYQGKKLIVALNVSIGVNSFLKKIGKTQYYDRTGFYMSMLWKESKIKYWIYLLKIWCKLGTEATLKFNKIASDTSLFEEKISLQIINQIKVWAGAQKRMLLNIISL